MPLRSLFVDMDAWLIAVLLAAAMVVAWVIGWTRGHTGRLRGFDPPEESRLDEAVLALLGLLLAFTFSMALNKYDHRRQMLITDSNAIGDFYTCATLAPEPARAKLQGVLRDYVRLRLDLARSGFGPELNDALARFQEMHGRMTAYVGEAIAAGTPIAIPLTNTLNGVTSSHAARIAAIRDRLPDSIVALLLFAATLTSGLVGRQQGFSPRASLAGIATFIAVVALTVAVTLDLNQPARGFIQVSQEPMQRLLDSMGK